MDIILSRSKVLFILFGFACLGWAQTARLVPADLIQLPGVADSNSPSHWTGDKLVVFNSDGMPIRSEGSSVTSLGRSRAVRFYTYDHAPLWIESTYQAANGALYAWYHHEVFLHCPGNPVSAPEIGALVSYDDGLTFFDLGIVLSAGHEANCETRNRYFGGGTGDFTVIADPNGEYMYFLYSNYAGPSEAQGIATARIAISDLAEPNGKVFKYFQGEWIEPGLGGQESPVFGVASSWDSEEADAFWGPSVHFNEHLGQYVMVMNHTCCGTDWRQEGIYVSFGTDLSQPWTWQQPQMVMAGGGWYPMVMGDQPGQTDKRAGKTARFFMGSDSQWLIEFEP